MKFLFYFLQNSFCNNERRGGQLYALFGYNNLIAETVCMRKSFGFHCNNIFIFLELGNTTCSLT